MRSSGIRRSGLEGTVDLSITITGIFSQDLSIFSGEQLCKLWIDLLVGSRRKLCCLCRGEGCQNYAYSRNKN